MARSPLFTKVLVVSGLVLVWVPLIAPIAFTVLRLTQGGDLRFDYLMPAELFPLALAGGMALLWASVRMRRRTMFFGAGMAAMLAGIVGSQWAAVATGLASGEAEATGWRLVVVAGLLGVYTLSVIVIAVGGILLMREKPVRDAAPAQGPVVATHE